MSEIFSQNYSDFFLQNAGRYGFSQQRMDRVAEMVESLKSGVTKDGEAVDSAEVFRDYMFESMTDRLMSRYSPDRYKDMDPADMMFDLMSPSGRKNNDSSDLSMLLNMHFDLNTLQMLQK